MDEEATRRLAESVDRLTIAMSVLAEATPSLALGFSQLETNTENLTEEQKKSLEQYKIRRAAEEREIAIRQSLNQALQASTDGLRSFKDSLLDTKEGFDKYGKSLDSFGDAVVNATAAFGPLALAAGLVVKGLTTLGSATLKQAEASLKARDDITKMGGAGVGTAEGVLKLAHAAGVTSKNLDILTKPMATLQGGLITLGTNAGKGAEAFLTMAAISKEERMNFRRLGLSQEEVMQAQADFVKLQVASGRNIGTVYKDIGQLRAASVDYTKNLVELAALTGTDIETAKRNQEFVKTQYAEQLRLRAEDGKIRSLQERRKTANDEERKAIDIEIKSIQGRQKAREQLGTQAAEVIGKEEGAFLVDYIASGVIKPGMEGLMGKINLAQARQEYLAAAGTEREAEVRNKILEKIVKATDQRAEMFVQTGSAMSEDMRRMSGVSQDSLVATGKYAGKSLEQLYKETQANIVAQSLKGNDATADAAAQLKEYEIATQVLVDTIIQKANPVFFGMGALTVVIGGLGSAVVAATLALNRFAASGALGARMQNAGGLVGPQTPGTPEAAAKSKWMRGSLGTGAIAGIGGLALSTAGQQVGGTAGKVMDVGGQALGLAGTGAMIGSMFGPMGTVIGGVTGGLIGFGKGLLDNRNTVNDNTEAVDKSTEITNDFAEYQKQREQKLKESNEKLNEILKDNSAALEIFKDKLGTISDEEFKKLIDSTEGLSAAQKEAIIAQRQEVQTPTAAADADATKFKQISEELKFTQEDQAKLEDKKRQIEMVQKDLFKSQNYEERRRLENILKSLRDEKKILENKKKAEEEYNELERERVAKEKEKQKERDATNKYLAELAEKSKAATPPTPAVAGSRGTTGGTRGQGRPASAGGGAGGGAAPAVAIAVTAGADNGQFTESDPDITDSDENQKTLVTERPRNVTLGPAADLTGLDSKLLQGFYSAAAEFGKPITVNSAVRGDQKQAELWVRGRILGDPGVMTPAKPKETTTISYRGQSYTVPGSGRGSKHREGDALDISGDRAGLDPLLAKYGLHRPYKQRDPPHVEIQAKKGGIVSGPDSGYPAELHGKEAIIPLGNNSILADLGKKSKQEITSETERAQTKKGGIVSGPDSGYPATLHGNEVIVPLDPNSILADLGKKSKQEITSETERAQTNITTSINNGYKEILSINQAMMEMLSRKLDNMIDKLETSNTTQGKLLKRAQV